MVVQGLEERFHYNHRFEDETELKGLAEEEQEGRVFEEEQNAKVVVEEVER